MGLKPTVLIFVGTYIPGYKGGGPVRSIEGLVGHFGDAFDLRIVTSDRDLGESTAYNGIIPGEWTRRPEAWVMYLSPKQKTFRMCLRILEETPWQVLYLNSFFSRFFSILPVVLVWFFSLDKGRVLLAPRGEFSLGALRIRQTKKRLYIVLSGLFEIYKNCYFHASTKYETADIERVITPRQTYQAMPLATVGRVFEARDVQGNSEGPKKAQSHPDKRPGVLKLIFVSRISGKKNLLGAIRLLASLRGEVEFNIYGPIEDEPYWRACQREIEKLSSNVQVVYRGAILHSEVAGTFARNHVFLFPTFGENFGHVILEALQGGCPVLLSDQTPWRGLEAQGIGWDLPLNAPERFVAALEHCLAMGRQEYESMSERARNAGIAASLDVTAIEDNRRMFESLLGKTDSSGPQEFCEEGK